MGIDTIDFSDNALIRTQKEIVMAFRLNKHGSKHIENANGADKIFRRKAFFVIALVIFFGGMICGFFLDRIIYPSRKEVNSVPKVINVHEEASVSSKEDRLNKRFRAFRGKTDQLSGPGHSQGDNASRIASLGYLSGYKPVPKEVGVLTYDKHLTCEGLNFMASGHGSEALLLSMDGRVLHKWYLDAPSIWPDYDYDKRDHDGFWRRAHLSENGDVLAIFDWIGLAKMDKDSNLLWSYAGKAHHDLYIAADDHIFVLDRAFRKVGINLVGSSSDRGLLLASPVSA